MPFSTVALPTAEQDAFNADISMANPTHGIRDQVLGRILEWRTSGSFTSGSDVTDPLFPVTNAFDDFTHKPTRPLGSSTVHHLIGRHDSGPLPDFDTVAIIKHNLGFLAVTAVEVQVDDAAGFPSPTTIATFNPPPVAAGVPNSRLIEYQLNGGINLMRDVIFWRIRITKGSVFSFPEIGEVVFSRRRQLLRGILLPTDPNAQTGQFIDSRSRGGANRRYEEFSGMYDTQAQIVTFGTGEYDVVEGWWRDTDRAVHPFLWTPEPLSAGDEAFWVNWDPADFRFPFEAAKIRRGFVGMTEADQPFRELER